MKRLLATVLLLLSLAFATHAQTGSWEGKIDVQGTKLTLVFHLDGDEPTMDSPDQAAFGIPIQVERTETGTVTIRVPGIGASYEGVWMVRQIIGTFKQAGLSLPLTLTPEVKPNRPQNPVGPFPYTEEEITYTNGDATLAGTLVLPDGYSRKTPVLIMVTGSGQENRDEEIFDHRPFAVIADALARAGIATLRCDDRGVGGSTGEVMNATSIDFKEDALAGIKLLRERFDKVGVIGHSEGGTIALMLAAEGQADFIVSMAGMAVSGIETIVQQGRTSLKDAVYPDEYVDTFCKAVEEACEVRVHGGRMPFPNELDLPDDLRQAYQRILIQIQSPWMRKFLTLDMRPLLGGITCPVLAINGTKDVQVDCESNLGALRSGLPTNPRNKVEAIENANHLFQHCTTGQLTEYRQIEETVAPEVLEMMVQWLASCSAEDGWVKVEGNKFIGPDGKELVFRGLCFSDPVKLVRDGQWNERYFAEAADWGANAVRFAVHPTNLNSLGWEETFEAMDRGVEWAKKYGMYVIMDWHSIGNLKEERYTSPMYDTTKEETFKFWRTVAQRYKDEPTVALYEIFNEPTVTAEGVGTCTWSEWKELQERIIDAIRAENPKAVCLCAGFNWAYDLTPVATEPVDRPNVAYVSHPYPMKRSQPWEEQWEKDFGFVADTYPVICTEIGYCLEDEPGAHIPVMSTDVYGERITKYFEKKGISFTVWCFDPQWAPMLFSDWDFTPTTQGRFFKAYLQGWK